MRSLTVFAAVTILATGLSSTPAIGATAAATATATTAVAPSAVDPPTDPRSDRVADPDAVLPSGWRTSDDVAWTTSGDATALHVLTASARTGYVWHTAASLSEPGFDADQWIGNACLTGSGRRLVVVYAPRTFTNKADLSDRGGFTAVVDLQTGAVTKVPVLSTLAYFNPGCGANETAVITQYSSERAQTRLVVVDAVSGRLSAPALVNTTLTSAVPVAGGFVAAGAGTLVRVDKTGKTQRWVATTGIPFRLVPDATGGVVFAEHTGDDMRIRRVVPASKAGAAPSVVTLAQGRLNQLGLTRGSGGRAFVTGTVASVQALPAGVRVVPTAMSSEISSTGVIALNRVHAAAADDPRVRSRQPGVASSVQIDATVTGNGKAVRFLVAPSPAAAGGTSHPKLAVSIPAGAGRAVTNAALGSPTDPVEEPDERTCSVPRNDPWSQAMQPKPRQVEWAVDQAITDSLTVVRPAGWKHLAMPQYTPQGLFPGIALAGGGRVPAQVMLAITAQESNMWQAARYALPGVTANPLIGNYYGRNIYDANPADDWDIHWDQADCGYGVTQVTDHMRLAGKEKGPGDTAWAPAVQRAVALDFAANVAAGLQILQSKWNETYNAGLRIHDGSPDVVENWFFAVWAYNSGFHPDQGNGEPWGVGWGNNPINPRFDPQREPFLELTYDDARTPQRWPYPEKIMGWAGHPITLNESPDTEVSGYRAAWWTDQGARYNVRPPKEKFCDASNNCIPGATFPPTDPDVAGEPAGPCDHVNALGQHDLRCWYHQPVGWKVPVGAACTTCGNEILRFDPGWEYQADGTSFPPKCDLGGLGPNWDAAKVIDNVGDGYSSPRPDCDSVFHGAGDFTLDFAADGAGLYPSKVDFHQIGAGFRSHMWRAHTVVGGQEGGKLKVTGTWKLTQPITGWTRILVSVPDHGAWSQQADYRIDLGNGQTRHRVISQVWQEHRWIDLGVFLLNGRASVSLSNVTQNGGGDSIIMDAVAFMPAGVPPAEYVALGDGFASGEGLEPYDRNSDYTQSLGDEDESVACHRTQNGAYPQGAYPKLVTLPGQTLPIAYDAANYGHSAFASVACAGATTNSVSAAAANTPPSQADLEGHTDWGGRGPQHGEVTQLESGFVDVDTSLVTISVGANDIRWGDLLHGCIFVNPFVGCSDPDSHLTRQNGVVDPAPLRDYEMQIIQDWLPSHLKATYRDIHAKAPYAKIIVIGYPRIAVDDPSTGCVPGVTPDTQNFLNAVVNRLDITIAKAVAEVRDEGVDIEFADANLKWREGVGTDTHFVCPSNGAQRWQHAILGTSSTGSGDNTPGVGSFHPNQAGQQALADLVSAVLRGFSPVSVVKQRILTYVASRASDGWSITDAQAESAAQDCLRLTRLGGLTGDPCMTQPIVLPSVGDADGAARNDAAALAGYPQSVQLNYVSGSEKGAVVPRSWMDTWTTVPHTLCPSPRPAGMQCDEYPFYSSEQGAAWDPIYHENSPTSARLQLVPTGENGKEGAMVGAMYTKCGLTSGTYNALTRTVVTRGSPYLTIPLVNPSTAPAKTMYVC